MSRRRAAPNVEIKPWLSAKQECREGRFIQVGNSLLCGKDSTFKELTSGAQVLYFCLAMESGGKNSVAFSRTTAEKYGIGKNPFARQIKELIEHGFIEIDIEGSYAQFKPTVYRFVYGWKQQKSAPETGSRNDLY